MTAEEIVDEIQYYISDPGSWIHDDNSADKMEAMIKQYADEHGKKCIENTWNKALSHYDYVQDGLEEIINNRPKPE